MTPDELIHVFLIYSLLPRPSQNRRVKVAATAAASAFAPSNMPLFRAFIQFSPEKCRPSAAGLLPSPAIVSAAPNRCGQKTQLGKTQLEKTQLGKDIFAVTYTGREIQVTSDE